MAGGALGRIRLDATNEAAPAEPKTSSFFDRIEDNTGGDSVLFARRAARIATTLPDIGRLEADLTDARARLAAVQADNGRLREERDAILGSRSWRLLEAPRTLVSALRSKIHKAPTVERATPAQMYEASLVRTSALFDKAFYLASTGDQAARPDPALHYLLVGEAAGLAPSPAFRAAEYRRLNPDLAGGSLNMLYHYEAHGRGEGRRHALLAGTLEMEAARIKAGRPTLLLLQPAAGEDDAVDLGIELLEAFERTHNVVVVMQDAGRGARRRLERASAVVGPVPAQAAKDPREARLLAQRLVQHYRPAYMVANGLQTRALAVGLREAGIPLVALAHRFPAPSTPMETRRLYEVSDALVFPSEAVRRDSVSVHGLLRQRRTHVLPFGLSEVSKPGRPAGALARAPAGAGPTPWSAKASGFQVVGSGPLDLGGGVDLFMALAIAFRRAHAELDVQFTWRHGEDDEATPETLALLRRQLEALDLQESLSFSRTDDAELLDRPADALVLCARSGDTARSQVQAAARGVPVLCFAGAGVLADVLQGDPEAAWLVAPEADAAFLAEALATLARDEGRRAATALAVQRIVAGAFDMGTCVQALDRIGTDCARRAWIASADAELLVREGFDPSGFFRDAIAFPLDPADGARRYLDEVRNVDFKGPAVGEHHLRRGMAGFNPFIYARHAAGYDADVDGDPLVHFLRRGRPSGPWAHEVIRLDGAAPARPARSSLRAAIHGHFHYTDNIEDFLAALQANTCAVDLHLTTTSEAAAERLRRAVRPYAGGEARVEIMPNVGRDIGPFIRLLGSGLRDYDVVGHVHGKRSLHTSDRDAGFGDRWRNFLWQQLIGPSAPVVDIVLAAFDRDPRLGMVFPENEHFLGWEKNRKAAAALKRRLDLTTLPEHIEFPAGTMFWARPQSLRALTAAAFEAGDYPSEPLPDDGTMLHALERLLPLIVEAAGFRYATTYDPLHTRLSPRPAGSVR